MANKLQLLRTSVASKVPTSTELTLDGMPAINTTDKKLWIRMGSEIVEITAAANIFTDETHRFVTDDDITLWNAGYTLPIATSLVLGGVKVGTNINVDETGSISLETAAANKTGVLSSADWSTFNGKQAALGYNPVNKNGDTMTGALILSGAPNVDNGAANKKYVDDGLALKLALAGGTMTGALILSADPSANLGAATKQYVDGLINNLGGEYAAPVANLTDLKALVIATDLADKQIRLVEGEGAIYRFDLQSLAAVASPGVVAPDEIAPEDLATTPGRWIMTASATQSHEQLSNLQGGAANDHLHLTTTEKSAYDSHIGDATLHISSDQNTWLDAITVTSGEVNYLADLTGNIQDQLDGKQASLEFTPVNIDGDTMTGLLILSGDPSNVLGAVTKQYVDGYTVDCGTFT